MKTNKIRLSEVYTQGLNSILYKYLDPDVLTYSVTNEKNKITVLISITNKEEKFPNYNQNNSSQRMSYSTYTKIATVLKSHSFEIFDYIACNFRFRFLQNEVVESFPALKEFCTFLSGFIIEQESVSKKKIYEIIKAIQKSSLNKNWLWNEEQLNIIMETENQTEVVVTKEMNSRVTDERVLDFSRLTSVKKLIFEEGITELKIALNSFFEARNLKEIVLPESLLKIPDRAFANLVSLEKINIPSHLQSIGENAFVGCINLRSLYVPDSVQRIGADAFYGCRGFRKISIPEHLKYDLQQSGIGSAFMNIEYRK